MTTLLGKQQLLAWAAQVTGIVPCSKYDDLKDGLVFVALMHHLFPSQVEDQIIKTQRISARNSKLNWDLLRAGIERVGLPAHLCDRKGVAAGHQKPCYNMLVMFFFLSKLSQSTEFSVDFAHPIDDKLAAFLQSPESLQCLARYGVGAHESGNAMRGGANDQYHHHHGANVATDDDDLPNERHSMSPAHPVSSPVRRSSPPTPRGGGGTTPTPQQRGDASAVAASAGGGVQWSDRHMQEHGELIIARLRNEVQALRREKEAFKRELSFVRAIGQHALDQQRAMVEGEMARAHDQFAAQLATVRLEAEHEIRTVFERCRDQLARLDDALELERNVAAFGNKRSNEALIAEVSELRNQRAVLETKLATTRDEVDKAHAHARTHIESANAARAQLEKLVRTLETTAARAAQANLPDVLVDALGPAEQQPIVMRLRQQQLELEALRAAEARREEEIRVLRDRSGGNSAIGTGASVTRFDAAAQLEASFDTNAEIGRLRAQVERLKSANEFLNAQLSKIRDGEGGNSARAGGAADYNALLLTNGLTAPSATIGHHKVEELCAAALNAVKRISPGAALANDAVEEVRGSFWDLVAVCSALGARVQAAASTLVKMHALFSDANKAAMVERHSRQHEVAELRAAATRREAELQAAHAAQMSQIQLDARLERDELLRTRMEMEAAVTRMQSTCTAMLSDCERLMGEVKTKNATLTRAVSHFQRRDALSTELLAVFRQQRHEQYHTAHERQAAEARSQQLQQQLAALGDLDPSTAHSLSAKETDANNNVRECLGQLRQTLESSLSEVRASVEASSKLRQQLREQAVELEKAAAERQQLRQHVATLEARAEQLRQEVERAVRGVAEAAAARNSAEHTFSTVTNELEAYCERLYELVGQHREHAGLVVPKRPQGPKQRISDVFGSNASDTSSVVGGGASATPIGSVLGGGGGAAAAQGGASSRLAAQLSDSDFAAKRGSEGVSGALTPQGGLMTASAAATRSAAEYASSLRIVAPAPSSPIKLPAAITSGAATPVPAASTSSQQQQRAGGSSSSSGGVLSPTELERRKHEILARYGVKA